MKTCSKCQETLDESAFNKNKTRKDGLHSSCKKCNSDYCKNHYGRNKSSYIDKAIKYRETYKDWYKDLKSKLVCSKCDENHPACLHFHHLDPKTKKFTVSSAMSASISKSEIEEEIKKCVVLCANCHAKLHYV